MTIYCWREIDKHHLCLGNTQLVIFFLTDYRGWSVRCIYTCRFGISIDADCLKWKLVSGRITPSHPATIFWLCTVLRSKGFGQVAKQGKPHLTKILFWRRMHQRSSALGWWGVYATWNYNVFFMSGYMGCSFSCRIWRCGTEWTPELVCTHGWCISLGGAEWSCQAATHCANNTSFADNYNVYGVHKTLKENRYLPVNCCDWICIQWPGTQQAWTSPPLSSSCHTYSENWMLTSNYPDIVGDTVISIFVWGLKETLLIY